MFGVTGLEFGKIQHFEVYGFRGLGRSGCGLQWSHVLNSRMKKA